MFESVIKTIEVSCGQEKAFQVFVNEMPRWWPLEKCSVSMMDGQLPKSLAIETRQGGGIVETGHDDAAHHWGKVVACNPHDYFSMDFYMGLSPGKSVALVELRFTSLEAERSRIELTHSNWEAYGDMAEMMHNSYAQGWNIVLGAYQAACEG